ncbi:MAG: hypothetical protein WD294_03040 [Phycisphaeraceae bacterium]
MRLRFQELDNQDTPLGELSLRVRASATLPGTEIHEVTLNGEFLMSSLINDSERALATLALDALGDRPVDVLVGGLGLGYTAAAALEYPNVRRVRVVEYLAPVINWHRERLVPAAAQLVDDPRCEIVHADFFDQFREQLPEDSAGRYDAILLDIDHAPEALLNASHGRFYSEGGLVAMQHHLRPGGIFGLWSAEVPGEAFLQDLRSMFASVALHEITFFNPLHNRPETNTVVLARAGETNAA